MADPVPRSEIQSALQSKIVAEIPLVARREPTPRPSQRSAALHRGAAAGKRYPRDAAALDVLADGRRRTHATARSTAGRQPAGCRARRAKARGASRRCCARSISCRPAPRIPMRRSSPSCARRSRTSPPTSSPNIGFEGSAEELAALRQEIVDEALGLGRSKT